MWRCEPTPVTHFPAMFQVQDINSAPAGFDPKKLLHVNAEHLRALFGGRADRDGSAVHQGGALGRSLRLGGVRPDRAGGADPRRDAGGGARLRRLPVHGGSGDHRGRLGQGNGSRRRGMARGGDGRAGRSGRSRQSRCTSARSPWPRSSAPTVASSRLRSGWRSPAGELVLRCSSPWLCWVATRCCVAWAPRGSASMVTATEPRADWRDPGPARRGRLRWVLFGICALVVAYLGWSVLGVVLGTSKDQRDETGAIVVLGAAQYDGTPSPVLQARLDHALELYQQGVAPEIVLTGSKQEADRFTEAYAGFTLPARRRSARGRDVGGRPTGNRTYESLAATARVLEDEGVESVTLVSDGYHNRRLQGIAVGAGPRRSGVADLQRTHRRSPRTGVRAGGGRRTGRLSPPGTVFLSPSAIRYRDPAPLGSITFRGWCNRQHIWFWSRHWGFESSPPSATRSPPRSGGRDQAPIV